MKPQRWSIPCLLAAALLIAACLPDSDSSGRPPVPGGPPKDPDAVPRIGGNGPRGLDHELRLFGIAPTQGPTAGGATVLIVGFNFHQDGPVTEVLFGSEPAATFDVLSNNQIDAVTPPHPAGLVSITVRNAAGREPTLEDVYEFVDLPAPCMSLTPSSGVVGGGETVAIDSLGTCQWYPATEVFFGANPAISVLYDPVTGTVTVITPPAIQPGPVDVTATGLDAQGNPCTCVLPDGFDYVTPSTACMILYPDSGSIGGGSPVTLINQAPCDWVPPASVLFDNRLATILNQTPFQIDVITPPGRQPGLVDVEVIGPTGTACDCLLPNGYDYQ